MRRISNANDGAPINFTGNVNTLAHCASCTLPMFLVYDHNIRSICEECGGKANPNYDAADMLAERREARIQVRRDRHREALDVASS